MEDYEKKYKEALKRARNWKDKSGMPKDKQGILDDIFPELKESEDEKIRKELVNYFTEGREFLSLCSFGRDKILAWLEKQDKQKPADTDNKFIRMRETKPKDISEFLDRLTTVKQEFLWEHIAKIRELDKEKQKPWSEEDMSNVQRICKYLDEAKKYYADITDVRECINWLKSLKERVIWKPSDKQIRALRWVLNNIPYNTHKEEISGLLDQIKDL